MHARLLSLAIGLSFVTGALTAPNAAKAQGYSDRELIGAVVSFATDERVELHTLPRAPGTRASTVTYTYRVYNLGDTDINEAHEPCEQAETLTVETPSLISTITVEIIGNVLRINGGQAEAVLDSCFSTGGSRNSITVGLPFPPGHVDESLSDSSGVPPSQDGRVVVGHAIVRDGRTVDTESYVCFTTGGRRVCYGHFAVEPREDDTGFPLP